ncbi:MAG TPA: rod shape-determining protein [Methylomirabilota bacterium]|jgi:rod shape-determining protein MreB|nr:rod shape-determining protein [Methylomirabilota bacterium]
MNLGGLGRVFSSDLAVDLGTSNTRLYVRGQGVVLDEPSVVAVDVNGAVQAVGNDAKAMLGRAPGSVQVVRPLRHGVIADFERTQKMFRYFINKTRRRWSFVQPRLVIVTPAGITQVERRAVRDAAQQAGAREVYLVQASMAAALGAGLPVEQPGASMIVDVGGGTTEVAVMSLCGIVYSESLRIAGDEMNQAIIHYLRRAYDLLVGERRAEDAKIRLGSAYPKDDDHEPMAVQGRDLLDGLPKTVVVTALEVREALREPVADIITAVRACLEHTPPELAADISDNGIVLTGGGALLRGLDELMHQETGLSIRVTEDPLTCVARGAGMILDELGILKRVAIPA